VKVVFGRNGKRPLLLALSDPFVRDAGAGRARYKHLGIYAYRRGFLLKSSRCRSTELEKAEKLEQLRALENVLRSKCWLRPTIR